MIYQCNIVLLNLVLGYLCYCLHVVGYTTILVCVDWSVSCLFFSKTLMQYFLNTPKKTFIKTKIVGST